MKSRPVSLRKLFVLVAALVVGLFAVNVAFGPEPAAIALITLNVLAFALMTDARVLGVNSQGTLSGAMVLRKALELTFVKRAALKFFAIGLTDLDGQAAAANLNQSVITRTRSIPAIGNLGDAAADMNTTDVSVSLTAIKQCLVTMTPTQANSTDRDLIAEAAEPMSVALMEHIIDSASGVVTSRNFSRSVTVGAGWTYDNTLRPLRLDLNKNGVPRDSRRYMLANADVDDSLLGDSKIIAAFNNPLNANAIANGILPRTAGLQYDDYPAMSLNNSIVLVGATLTAGTDLVTSAAHKLVNGDRLTVSALVTTTGIVNGQIVFVIAATTNTFQLSLTAGGAAIDLATGDGTATFTLAENLIGYAGIPNAVIAAIRPPKNPEELLPGAKFPGVLGYVTEPISGATFMVNQWIGTDLSLNSRFVWLEGFQPGDKNNLTRLVSA